MRKQIAAMILFLVMLLPVFRTFKATVPEATEYEINEAINLGACTFSAGDEKRFRWLADSNHRGFDVDDLAERNWGFDGAREWGDFAYVDEDSAELVIGIDDARLDAYVELSRIIDMNGGQIVNTVSMREVIWAVVADIPFDLIPSFVNKIKATGLAKYVEPNMRFQIQFVPNDPDWSWQWGPQKIEADWAWNTTIGDPAVLVCVVDTGIDWNHPDLAANYVALGYDWVNEDTDPMDDHGHGTHCAGIIAAALNNGIGIAGLAQVRVMAEKGLDSGGGGYEDDLANAILHAVDQGVDILSNSWGGYVQSALIYDAVKYAYDTGVLIVAATGNDATRTKSYPAAYDEVIAVTATDQYDNPASLTNFGDWVEVAAPGVDILSTVWDDTYTYKSGTSMSTPHVSGVAALIWSQFPYMTRDQVRAQLRYTAEDLGDEGFDDYYGYGRINARNAVEQASPDHDLLIFDWNRPPYVKLGEPTTFNTTVLNFGTSYETDVEVHLLVNGSLVNSTSIAFLPSGTSTTVGLSWIPIVGGTYNVTSYIVPVPGETITQNNLITEIITVVAPPSETNWTLLATDTDEGNGTNLKVIYGQLYSGVIFFKVTHYRPWITIAEINTGIFLDTDQNPGTGLPDGTYPGQNTSIGADYLIVVGFEATKMWKWDPAAEWWDLDNPISLAYLDAPDASNVFVVGVYRTDVKTAGFLDCAVSDAVSDWDWMPDTGHFTFPALATMDLELYPREVVDLEDPTGAQWHELHPVKSNFYNLIYWKPGMVLSPYDQIVMEPVEPTGPLEEFEVDEVTVDLVVLDEGTGIEHWLDYKCGYWTFDPRKPISTKWNEIKPDLGRCWHLTGWEDDGDGKLSFCDYIDMKPMFPFSGPVTWFHVEQVTVTLKLTSKLELTQRYLEFMGILDEFQDMDYLHDPISTMWHETWPEQGRIWHLSSWEDSLVFSPSDQIVLTLKDEFGEPIPGTEAWYHVDKLTVAMNLTSMLDEREHIVKSEGSLKQFMEYEWADPVSTQWHEVNPDYCRQWHLTYWEDTNINGILDSFDLIEMIDKETGEPEWFHVESLSTDIIVTKKPKVHDVTVIDVTPSKTVVGQGYTMSIDVTVENQGGFPETFNVTAYYSNETLTSEQWETFWSWGDVNRDGYIDDIDVNLLSAAYSSTPGDPNWNPDADLNQNGHVDIYDLIILQDNIGKDIWTESNILGGSIGRQTVNHLPPGSTTLVFTWNTTGIPYGNYIISAKATRILGETDVEDNTLVDGTVFVTIIGDVDGDGSVDYSDLLDLTEAYGSEPGDDNWNPNCDLNNDGKVDASDLFDLSKNYGKTI